MAIRHARSVFLNAALALLAVLGVIGLSGWHDAMVHDEDPVHAASVLHGHTASPSDPDAPIHTLAHAIGQWIVHGGVATPLHLIRIVAPNWAIASDDLPGGTDPAALLRPPRS
ncbi:hypothetical protein [Sphingomonas parapaucimobilis]|uniref:Uncharacterized protein n=1 Tax=Sphingomonas parapaucimobilis NBRC 15100 TaxID=1219049 RepID=A0A0A1W877_9SPHN|nr:hypothetical protein [Sphingomonas parapaucimobilis]GAM01533.1 hypothetical protein SP5_064_00660 [Sphingomonas parapaucimobilis NBRC 15100]